MKILMTTDTVGGVWAYALELSRALQPHGVEIALATMGAPLSDGQQREVADLTNVTSYESAYALEWMPDPWVEVTEAGQWLLQVARVVEPDVVHLNGYCHAVLPWEAPTLVVGHSCVLSWWAAVYGEDAPDGWITYRQAVRAGLHAADAVAAPTHAMGDALCRHYDLSRRPTIIPNARRADAFRAAPKHPFIFSAGRLWDEAKNLRVLDEAAAGLRWPVYVAGPLEHPAGPDGGRDAGGLHVRMLGRLDPRSLRPWLATADLYVLPARYEPFGLSVLEAALSGCSLVLGDIPSLRELWDGVATFVDPGDPAGLHETLRELISDPKRRWRRAQAAHERARQFSPQRMAEAYIRLYDRLIRTDRPAIAPIPVHGWSGRSRSAQPPAPSPERARITSATTRGAGSPKVKD